MEGPKTAHDGGQWETTAKEWLSSLPQGHTLSMSEVENWVNSNLSSLPDHLKSLSQSDILQRFTDLQSSLQPKVQEKTVKQANRGENPARFQRTDQWRPVYTWLESLDLDEVIKSKDISDWLAANPTICDELCSRHSRYHLTHYIKKCHVKILKKRNITPTSGLQKPNEATPVKVDHLDVPNLPTAIQSNQLSNVSRDSDLYRVKREEALRKYEMLVELEEQLFVIIPKRNTGEDSKGS